MAGGRRIPQGLVDVFVESNKGGEVHRPPADGEANKVYVRRFVQRSKSTDAAFNSSSNNNNNDRGTLFGQSLERVRGLRKDISISSSNSSKAEVYDAPVGAPRTPRARRKSFNSGVKVLPQTLLDEQMVARGYSTDTYNTLQTAYYNQPTALQMASYGPYTISLLKSGNASDLRQALQAGLSPNACNRYGESLVHMVCRRGRLDLLNLFLEFGASVQLVDDYGRTCLHDACWSATPNFGVVSALLERDPRMFYLKDCRGSLPLSYVHRDHLTDWQQFLESTDLFLDKFYPIQDVDDEAAANVDDAPALCKLWPNARPPPNPKNALPCELASLVAHGKLTPEEALILRQDQEDATTDLDESESEDMDEEDSYIDDDDDDDDDSSLGSMDNEELLHLSQLHLSASNLSASG